MSVYSTNFIKKSLVNVKNSIGKKHIAVVGGGMSAEREVSLVSSAIVTDELVKQGYKVTFIDMGTDIANILSDIKPELVFNALHGTYGEDGCLPGLLNIMHIPYTHSGLLASAICLDKIRTKELFAINQIMTPRHVVLKKSYDIEAPMQKPYVIKPINQGSSLGVKVILVDDDFDFKNYNFPYGNSVIVEEYIKGHELQVAVLDGKAYGVLEVKTLKRNFYDYDSKYKEGFTEHILPAKISTQIYDYVLKTSEKIYNVLGCRGLIRVEFIYDEDNEKVYALEVNTHPGMTPLSICQEILDFHGIGFDKMIDKLVQTACFE